MARHMLATALIVCGIYLGLLAIIDHPLSVVSDSVASESNTVAPKVHSTQSADEVPVTKITSGNKTDLAHEQSSNVQAKVAPGSTQLMLPATTIVGAKAAIEMKNAQQEVAQLWLKFTQMSALQNNVDWSKGSIVVYAYYHNFNQDFSWADLSIGFNLNDLELSSNASQVQIQSGPYAKFLFVSEANTASDEAWAKAYQYKNLIERHTLNAQGQLVGTDVIVIKR